MSDDEWKIHKIRILDISKYNFIRKYNNIYIIYEVLSETNFTIFIFKSLFFPALWLREKQRILW